MSILSIRHSVFFPGIRFNTGTGHIEGMPFLGVETPGAVYSQQSFSNYEDAVKFLENATKEIKESPEYKELESQQIEFFKEMNEWIDQRDKRWKELGYSI